MKKESYTIIENLKFIYNETLKKDKKLALSYILQTTLKVGATVTILLFPRSLISELTGRRDIHTLLLLLTGFFLCSIICYAGIKWIEQIFYSHMIVMRYRFMEMHQSTCLSTAYENFENTKYQDKMYSAQKCIQSNDYGIEGVMHRMFQIPGNILSVVTCLSILSSLHWLLMLFLITNIVILFFVVQQCRKIITKSRKDIMHEQRHERYYHSLINDFSFAKELRLFNLSSWLLKNLVNCCNRQYKETNQVSLKVFFVKLFEWFLESIRHLLVYGYVVYQILKGIIDIASFTMYVSSIIHAMENCISIMDDISFISEQNPYINEFRSFIEESEENSNSKTLPDLPFKFEFKNVYFSYPGSKKEVLKNINLIINSGEKIALVGENGSGKTTLLKLLLQLYDVKKGKIFLNNIEANIYNKNDYYKKFSVVFQEVAPLAYTIAENISLSEKHLQNREKIVHCLKQTGLLKRIESLTDGIDSYLTKSLSDNGVQLSGGEMQLLLITRALYHSGNVIVMDEPTSALDPIKEQDIYQKMNLLSEGKTTIFVSHRLMSTQFCDKIIFMKNGEIVEIGSHKELMDINGMYADMWAVQSQYYQNEVISYE